VWRSDARPWPWNEPGSAPRKSFVELFPEYTPWPLHQEAERLASELAEPSLVVIEAPMGEGKTEAAMLLANAASSQVGQGGLFIGLPTRATANQMFVRTRRYLERTGAGESITLLLAHGEADLVEAFHDIRLSGVYDGGAGAGRDGAVRAEAWFMSKKRALLGEHAVGTIDQALLAAMLVKHNFVRFFGLAGKTVVLDEVHAYDTYMGRLLDRLVEWLAAAGATIIILSATLPPERREDLVQAYRRGAAARREPGSVPPDGPREEPSEVPYPRITLADVNGDSATSLRSRRAPVTVELSTLADDVATTAAAVLSELDGGGCVGWICNTVSRAQRAYQELRALAPGVPAMLLHSRLFPDERLRREQQLEAWLGPEREGRVRPERCVVVGTQVLEQSLDVDFDLLITDVAPVDLVLQRAGRLFRHERQDRATSRSAPHLWLVVPEPGDDEALKAVAIVYERVFIERTLALLRDRASIELPTEIEDLVKHVYDRAVLPGDHPLSSAQIEQMGKAAAQRTDAEKRLLPRVDRLDDPFGELTRIYEEDDDPMVAALVRAKTRDARESVTIVFLERRDGGLFASSEGETVQVPVDLDREPDAALTRRLVERSISVSRPGVVRALAPATDRTPESWSGAPLLRYRRVVEVGQGRAEVGGVELTIHPDLGLVLSAPNPRGGGGA